MAADPATPRVWVLAGFPTGEALVAAVRRMRRLGHEALDTHTPFPVHGLDEALALPRSPMSLLVGGGGFAGAALGYLMMWWCNAVDYPINVGGRPPHSAPAFIPITFECGILAAALVAFLGVLGIMGLPRPHHPTFEAERFRRASVDEFWLSVECEPALEADVAAALPELGAHHVERVEVLD